MFLISWVWISIYTHLYPIFSQSQAISIYTRLCPFPTDSTTMLGLIAHR